MVLFNKNVMYKSNCLAFGWPYCIQLLCNSENSVFNHGVKLMVKLCLPEFQILQEF